MQYKMSNENTSKPFCTVKHLTNVGTALALACIRHFSALRINLSAFEDFHAFDMFEPKKMFSAADCFGMLPIEIK